METVGSMAELRTFVIEIECPGCHEYTLQVELRKENAQLRQGLTLRPWIVCRDCDFEDRGEDA